MVTPEGGRGRAVDRVDQPGARELDQVYLKNTTPYTLNPKP